MKGKKTAALLSLCALLASCAKEGARKEAETEARVITVKKSELHSTIDTYGSVTYKKKNDVSSLVDGTIVGLFVQEGSQVKKGDIMLKMKNVQYEIQKVERENALNSATAKARAAENNLREEEKNIKSKMLSIENARATLLQKKGELDFMKKNLEKNKKVFLAGGIAASAYEQMEIECNSEKTEVEILEKELRMQEMGFTDQDLLAAGMEPSEKQEEKELQLLELNLRGAKINIELSEAEKRNAEQNLKSIVSLMENLTVRAPTDGIVGALNYENGERVFQNEKILTLIDMEEPYAQVTLQEKDSQKIQLGSPALVKIESLDYEQKSQVSFISPMADYETGNFVLKIPLKNQSGLMRLGMFAHCSIETKSSGKYFLLPEKAAIKRKANNVAFYCVENGYIFQKECPIEMEKDGKIYLDKGVSDGEKIVENPGAELKEGQHVKAI